MNTQAHQYFNVVTSEDGGVPEILLYGYIGQQDFWGEDKENDITDIEFVKALRKLEATHSQVNVRINSPGGMIYHGNAIISAIKNSKAEIHTYNDGMAVSMASGIWLAGDVRHMASNSLLMLHSPIAQIAGNAKDLREQADLLDTIEKTLIATLVEASNINEEQAKADFFNYEDHWLTAEEVMELGLIGMIEEEVENVIDDVQNMSLTEIMNHFEEKEDRQTSGLLKTIQAKLAGALAAIAPPKKQISQTQKNTEMNITEFNKSLENGELEVDGVVAALQAKGYQVNAPAEEAPATDTEATTENAIEAVKAELQSTIEAMKAQIEDLKKENKALGNQEGDAPAAAAATNDLPIGSGELDPLTAFNNAARIAAEQGRKGNFAS